MGLGGPLPASEQPAAWTVGRPHGRAIYPTMPQKQPLALGFRRSTRVPVFRDPSPDEDVRDPTADGGVDRLTGQRVAVGAVGSSLLQTTARARANGVTRNWANTATIPNRARPHRGGGIDAGFGEGLMSRTLRRFWVSVPRRSHEHSPAARPPAAEVGRAAVAGSSTHPSTGPGDWGSPALDGLRPRGQTLGQTTRCDRALRHFASSAWLGRHASP